MSEELPQEQPQVLPMTEMIEVVKEEKLNVEELLNPSQDKPKKYKELVDCSNCGLSVTRSNMYKHKQSKQCQGSKPQEQSQAGDNDKNDIVDIMLESYNELFDAVVGNNTHEYCMKQLKIICQKLSEIAKWSH